MRRESACIVGAGLAPPSLLSPPFSPSILSLTLVTREKGRIVAASRGERISSPLNKERDSTLWQRKAPPIEGSVFFSNG